jgi:hypothetical protein
MHILKLHTAFDVEVDRGVLVLDARLDLQKVEKSFCINKIRHQESTVVRKHRDRPGKIFPVLHQEDKIARSGAASVDLMYNQTSENEESRWEQRLNHSLYQSISYTPLLFGCELIPYCLTKPVSLVSEHVEERDCLPTLNGLQNYLCFLTACFCHCTPVVEVP